MISPQNQSPTVIESLDGTLTEWYHSIDGALRDSEIIPGDYEYSTEVSYQGQCPVQSGGSTNIDIKADRFKCVSFDNSYLEIQQKFDVTVPTQAAQFDGNKRYYYIGYKSAFDLIRAYIIRSNGDDVQTQNHACYESMLLNYAAISDHAKEHSDTYATYEKIQRMDPHVPGAYLDLTAITGRAVSVTLNFRIPLNMLLLFKNIKWYPGFFGKTTLEFYPTHENLVWCPIFPEGHAPQNLVTGLTSTMGFVQINNPGTNLCTKANATHTYTAVNAQTWLVSTSTLETCRVRLAQYSILAPIYNALMAQYLEIPLYFPVQEVKTSRFSQTLGAETDTSLTCSSTLNHCDSMFIVFNRTVHDRNCFINPLFSTWSVNIDGKYYPREPYATHNDVRFTNLSFDSLNVNNNTLLSVSEDVANSLQPYRTVQTYAVDGTRTTPSVWSTGDTSNFFIGIPFSNDEDFMGGINHPGTAQIQIRLTRADNTNFAQPPTAIFLEDKILKIRSMKPPGESQIAITNASIEQIKAGAR